MKKYLFLFLLSSTFSIAQTLSFTPTYHIGNYGEGTTELGKMEPTLDWAVSLSVPLTEKISVTPSVYYYFALYKDHIQTQALSNLKYYETFWYIGMTFEYTFSDKPLFK